MHKNTCSRVNAGAKGASENNLGLFQVEKIQLLREIAPESEFIHLNFFQKSPNSLISQKSENAGIHELIPNRTSSRTQLPHAHLNARLRRLLTFVLALTVGGIGVLPPVTAAAARA